MKIVLTVIVIAILFIILELLARKSLIEKEFGRKILHLFSALVAAYSPNLTQIKLNLIVAGIALTIISFYLLKNNLLPAISSKERRSWGIFYFVLAYTFLVIILPIEKIWVMQITFLLLGLSDSLAAIIGNAIGKNKFNLTRDKKSVEGSIVFFLTTFALFLFVQNRNISNILFEVNFPERELYQLILSAVYFSLVIMIVEAISSGGSDNVFISLFTAPLILIFLEPHGYAIDYTYIFLALPLSIGAAAFSFKLKILSASGTAAMLILALLLFGLGGVMWTLPILFFFISSSLISKMTRNDTSEKFSVTKKGDEPRNYLQVISNGGIGAVLIFFYILTNSELWYFIFVITIAVACADTWATELGIRYGRRTINIITFKPIETGLSGGVSLVGTTAAFAGSAAVGFISYYFLTDVNIIFAIILFGFFGSIIDSILGSTLQAKYQCYDCKKIIEKRRHCENETRLHKGFHAINNDSVNFLSGFISSIIFLIFF